MSTNVCIPAEPRPGSEDTPLVSYYQSFPDSVANIPPTTHTIRSGGKLTTELTPSHHTNSTACQDETISTSSLQCRGPPGSMKHSITIDLHMLITLFIQGNSEDFSASARERVSHSSVNLFNFFLVAPQKPLLSSGIPGTLVYT